MSGPKVVNLRRTRKQKARKEKQDAVTGTAPAVAELRRAGAEKTRAETRHEGHRLDKDD